MVIFSDPDLPDIDDGADKQRWILVPARERERYQRLRDTALSFKDLPGETGQAYFVAAKGKALTQLAELRRQRTAAQEQRAEATARS